MQTQGISLVVSGIPAENGTTQPMKASESTFESFMSVHASKPESSGVAKKELNMNSQKEESNTTPDKPKMDVQPVADNSQKADNDVNAESDVPVDVADFTEGNEIPEEIVEMAALMEQFVQIIQNIFGMSQEQVQDVLEQSGVDVSVLTEGFMESGSVEEMFQKLQDTLQNLVMDIHGVTDKSVFVTSDILNQEFEMLKEQMETLFTEFSEGTDTIMVPDQPVQTMLNEVPTVDETEEPDAGIMTEPQKESFEVIVETEMESDNSGENSQSGQTEEIADAKTEVNIPREAENTINTFTERLADAFENVRGEEVRETAQTMSRIVEQVIQQVKIRVMPQTTNMELMLHPASLGRVNISVSSVANGASTAVLTVENQIAKEALESQLIALKQSFDEQGLKVDAVEVTISDFGLHHENRDASQEQQNNSSGNRRRFRGDAGEEGMDEKSSDKETEETRRDVNSVVDYTA